ncbi:Tyrocidine synthase 3 [compost metagenome]
MVWSEVLGHNSIGVRDPFFEVGGNSLKALRLITEIAKRFGADISLKWVME